MVSCMWFRACVSCHQQDSHACPWPASRMVTGWWSELAHMANANTFIPQALQTSSSFVTVQQVGLHDSLPGTVSDTTTPEGSHSFCCLRAPA